MSEMEFESYLHLLGRFLRLSGDQREAIARELRDHMEERLEELLERGHSRQEATRLALDEFGDAAMLASEFGRIGRRRRWIMRTTTATVTIAATILLVSFLLPERRVFVPAPALSHAGEPAAGASGERAEAPAQAPRRQAHAEPTGEPESDRRLLEKLRATVPAVDFAEGAGFAEIIEFLRLQSKVSIDVNWPALALVNIERTTDPGGINLRDVKVETVLDILLSKASNAAGVGSKSELGWDVVDGTLRISTTEDLNSRTVVRIYDCKDLIGQALTPAQKSLLEAFARAAHARVEPSRPSAADAARSEKREAAAKALEEAKSQYGSEHPMLHKLERELAALSSDLVPLEQASSEGAQKLAAALSAVRHQDAKEFVQIIIGTVEPGTWAPEGAVGSICDYDGLLVVRHTWGTHQQVSNLLSSLRQAKAARGDKSSG